MTTTYETQTPIGAIRRNFIHRIFGDKKQFRATPEVFNTLKFNNLVLRQQDPVSGEYKNVFAHNDKDLAYYGSLGIQYVQTDSEIGQVALLSPMTASAAKIEKAYQKIKVEGFDKNVFASKSALEIIANEDFNVFLDTNEESSKLLIASPSGIQNPMELVNMLGIAVRAFNVGKGFAYILVTSKDSKDTTSNYGSGRIKVI